MRGSHPVESSPRTKPNFEASRPQQESQIATVRQHSGAAAHKAEIQLFFFLVLLFALLRTPLFGERFLLPDLIPGAFTATSS